jgi:hypothetical protein
MMDDRLDRLFRNDDDLADGGGPAPPPAPNKRPRKGRQFVIVPLDGDWGYRAVAAAGVGAGIVLYALRERRVGSCYVEVPITTTVCQRLGIDRGTRQRAIDRLVKAGFATVRHRGKFRGCPLLTLKPPAGN